jgi:hypothetical protein
MRAAENGKVQKGIGMNCEACSAEIPECQQIILKNLVTYGLKGERQAALAAMYGGEAPKVLCWTCFVPAVQVLNGVQQ